MPQTLLEVVKKLKDFNKDLSIRALRERYNSPSFFEMMSISRMENQHSAFIKWLLQGDEIRVNTKYTPLMGLLDILVGRAEQQMKHLGLYSNFIKLSNIIPEEDQQVKQLEKETDDKLKEIDQIVKNAILSRKIRLSNIVAKCERSVGELKVFDKSKDRIDIHIVCDVKGVNEIDQFEFIIENKVGSKEGDEKLNPISASDKYSECYNSSKQTERYVLGTRYADEKKPDFIENPSRLYQFYVFLTPISSVRLSSYDELEEDETCASEFFIHINYQDIVDYIIEPALSSNNLSDRVRVFLNEYLNNLSMPCEEDDEKNTKKKKNSKKNSKKNTIIMATYNQDIETIRTLWDKYHDLIMYSIILDKALVIDNYPTRQELFNENIINHQVNALKKYVWSKPDNNGKRIKININNNQELFVKDISNPNLKIERIKELSDLVVLIDFFQENKELLLSIMKILADQDNQQYDTVRDVYNTLSNPKDYTKYIVKYKGEEIKGSDDKVKVMSKRDVVVAFVENLGHEMTGSFKDGKTYRDFFNDKDILSGSTIYVDEKPDNSIRYNAYKWDSSKKNYINQGVADNNEGDIYFSNQWGCYNNNDGTFDRFLRMVSTHFRSFVIINLEEYNSQKN